MSKRLLWPGQISLPGGGRGQRSASAETSHPDAGSVGGGDAEQRPPLSHDADGVERDHHGHRRHHLLDDEQHAHELAVAPSATLLAENQTQVGQT